MVYAFLSIKRPNPLTQADYQMPLIKRIILLLALALLAAGQVSSKLACTKCHTAGAWTPLLSKLEFDHQVDTDFPLEFGHADLPCTSCHAGDNVAEFHTFKTPGVTCVACHQDVHQNYWGAACNDCHTPESWRPELAFRRHDLTLLPLTAAHRTVDCYLCHSVPNNIPSIECQSCHSNNFQPDLEAHSDITAQSDCADCHAPTRWNQILAINHKVFFPIYSGVHWGRWPSCSTCHSQPGDYQTFTCFGSGCHSASNMNVRHCEGSSCERCGSETYPSRGVQPEDCYSCHPQGNKNKCGD